MTFLKKLNSKFFIVSFLTAAIVVVAVYTTLNNTQKANAFNSSLTSTTDTAQYQKFYTITTPSSAPGGLNYLYYELPIIAGGSSTLDPNDYLEVAAIKTETLEADASGAFVVVSTKTFDYTADEISKAKSTATIGGKPAMVLKFSPGIGCGTGTTCTVYTDPATVPDTAKTYKANPNSRAQVSVTLKIKAGAPTLVSTTAFVSAANWVTPGGFPSDRITSTDPWNIALNYTQSSSSSSSTSSVASSTVSSSGVSSTGLSSTISSTNNSTTNPNSSSTISSSSTATQPSVITVPRSGGGAIAIAVVSGLGALGSFTYLSRRKKLKDGTGDISVKTKKSKNK